MTILLDLGMLQDDIELKKREILYVLVPLLIYQKEKHELLLGIQEWSLIQFHNHGFD